jgi:hypothetical protein
MTTTDEAAAKAPDDPNQSFYDKAIKALEELFEKAKAAHELHFVMGLMPEFHGAQDAGWNTAEEATIAYDQYTALLKAMNKEDPMRIRIALDFYLHVSEGSGFYEIPKKMLLTIEGKGNNLFPWHHLVKRHEKTGRAIDPNANRIMKDLMGHAFELGLGDLSDVFHHAFDSDLRNAVAHADYIIAPDGLRLRKKNGGWPKELPWNEFDAILSKGLNLFSFIRQIVDGHVKSYDPPKTIRSRLTNNEPFTDYMLYYVPETEAFGWTTGKEIAK